MKIAIIGSGNVATVLGKKIVQAGHTIVQVAGRSETHVKQLAAVLHCDYSTDYAKISDEADLYLLAISDDALTHIGAELHLGRKMIVHTAGSVSKEVLKPVSTNYGVLYPLQSLRKELEVLPEIPLLIDGNTADDLALIADFANTISDKVQIADDGLRLKLHLAAVMINNFSNHLYSLAEEYCLKEKADFHLLFPLIGETAHRLQYGSPKQMQTGPAIRHDQATLQKHLQLLAQYPQLRHVYEVLTKSIQQFH
jgi:predicted short-subunit dehydrogenase-like oxidoreductase (DUF2520 family)